MNTEELNEIYAAMKEEFENMGVKFPISSFNYIRRLNDYLNENDIVASLREKTILLTPFIKKELNFIEKNFRDSDDSNFSNHCAVLFLDKFTEKLNDEQNYSEVIKLIDGLQADEKELLEKIFQKDHGVIREIYKHITEIGPSTFDNKENFIKDTRKVFFENKIKDLLRKKEKEVGADSKYREFFKYISENILPALKVEQIAKFLMYVETGHLYNDYKTDKKLQNLMFKKDSSQQCINYLQEKMTSHQIPLYLEDANKNNPLASIYEYRNFQSGYNVLQATPRGYVDCAMLDSENPSLLYVLNVTKNRPESDFFAHLDDLIKHKAALDNYCKQHQLTSVSIDVVGGHDIEWIKENIINDEHKNNRARVLEIKEIVDTLIPRLAYFADNGGENKTIVILGDTKYEKSKLDEKHCYEVFLDFIKFINKDVIKIDNRNESVNLILKKSLSLYEEAINIDTEVANHKLLNKQGESTDLSQEISKNLIELTRKIEFNRKIKSAVEEIIETMMPSNLEKLYIKATFNEIREKIAAEKSDYENKKPEYFLQHQELIERADFKKDLKEITCHLGNMFQKLEKKQRKNSTRLRNINQDNQELIALQENGGNGLSQYGLYNSALNLPGHQPDPNKEYQNIIQNLYDIITGRNEAKGDNKIIADKEFFTKIINNLNMDVYEKEIFRVLHAKDDKKEFNDAIHNFKYNHKPIILDNLRKLVDKHFIKNELDMQVCAKKFAEFKADDSILKKSLVVEKFENIKYSKGLSMEDINNLQEELKNVDATPKQRNKQRLRM